MSEQREVMVYGGKNVLLAELKRVHDDINGNGEGTLYVPGNGSSVPELVLRFDAKDLDEQADDYAGDDTPAVVDYDES